MRILNRNEEIFENVDIAGGLTFLVLRRSWQALWPHHRLSDQLKTMLHPLEEEGVVPVRHEEIIIKSTIFDTEPRLVHIINGVML